MKRTLSLFLLILCASLFLAPQAGVCAESTKDLTRKLKAEKKQAESKKKRLTTLSRRASRLKRTVSREEAKIAKLSRSIATLEEEYRATNAKKTALQTRYTQTTAQHGTLQAELALLIKQLWPLYISNHTVPVGSADSWDELDRKYTWISRLYNAVDSKQRILKEQERELERIVTEQTALTATAKRQLDAVNAKKDDLLKQKLSHRKQLKKIAAQKHSAEASLRNILSIIETLNYKIEKNNKSGANFSLLKGVLPWPANGVVSKYFAPRAKPPVRGIGMSLAQGSDVRAVSSGKVVHNDVLRGFGRVVILMHGEEYYSLYAFLENSPVAVGNTLKQKQVIGQAGFYPAVDGTGLYFELRFHQKAINPETWLSALN
ncbi:MAG: peptidoglycan DD-metalloendopeptidase family protein [Desulfovibrionales bacterium]|nr:peptidoglycan DD-metalloendopeptidase family protein [Desulfovibrionales bacterium]